MELGYANVTEAQVFAMCLNLAPFFFGILIAKLTLGHHIFLNHVDIFGISVQVKYLIVIPSVLAVFSAVTQNIIGVVSHSV